MPQNSYIKNKIWTIGSIFDWGIDYLNQKSIDSPRINIELLLCHVLKLNRLDLYLNFEKPLSNDELQDFKSLLKRRLNHEPLQYIIGKSYFYGNEFIVNPSVLIPRPETELLVDFFNKQNINNSNSLQILDVGTGSGAIAISIAKVFPNFNIHAIDISEEALSLARKNAELNNVSNIQFYLKNILNSPPFARKFDIIISNPPYIDLKEYKILEPEVLKHEPKQALTDNADGLTFYKFFAKNFRELLIPNGSFYLEIGFGQYNYIKSIFNSNNIEVNCIKDLNSIDRILYGKL